MDTRSRILEAAIAIIESDGESEIRVDQVVADAGFTKPVLYHHFQDKDDLIVAAQAERYLRTMQLGLEETLAAARLSKSPEEYLAVLGAWLATFSTREGEQRRRLRMEVLGSAVSRPDLQARIREANRVQAQQLAGFIEIARDRGWLLPGVSAESVSVWWVGLILSRYLVDMDSDFFDPAEWDALTAFAARTMIAG